MTRWMVAAGSDRLHGGPGFDTIILRAGDGASTVEAADVLLDFQDGVMNSHLMALALVT